MEEVSQGLQKEEKMKYLLKSFSVGLTGNKKYEDNYKKIFKKPLWKVIEIWIEKKMAELFL
jgi:hypothetical protein